MSCMVSVRMTCLCITDDETYNACDDGNDCRHHMSLALKVACDRGRLNCVNVRISRR
jgi:hypothetical protein